MGFEHVLVAGGGSGGHVFPALAVVHELAARGCRVSWLGRVDGMEKSLVKDHGMPYYGLPAAAVVGRGLPQRVLALGRTALSAVQARSLIRRHGIDVVLGTGGYASAPGVLGARLAGRPAVLLEPNATSGTANRWLSRWAAAAAVASLQGTRDLGCRVEPIGVPVRSEFQRPFEPPAQTGPLRILVLGGSQGARQLNELLPEALAELAPAYPGLEVMHQVGEAHVDDAERAYAVPSLTGLAVRIVPFLQDMAMAMSSAHLVISRAGAITLAEVCAIGRAALLLPLGLAGSHQVANARRVVATGGARMIFGDETNASALARVMSELLASREGLTQMGCACRLLYRREAATDIADLLAEVAGAA
jgi:UDP-N-acetylglucosamine--N-acetylmuramyl-(pentapeptide) pyrophosphoryl-undecaprenol N-acetylglucosamine transferase